MSKEREIKSAEFEELVLKSDKVSIVDFWAPWCGYCIRMMPVFEALAEELGDKVNFIKINADEEVDLCQSYQIEVLPTFLVIKNGEVVNRKIGYVPQGELKEAIESAL